MILLSESNGIIKNGIASGIAQSYGVFTNLSLGSSGIVNPIWRVATGILSTSPSIVVVDTCVNDADFLYSALASGRDDALLRWFVSYQKLLSSIISMGHVPILLFLPYASFSAYSKVLKRHIRELSAQFSIPYLDVEDILIKLAGQLDLSEPLLYQDPAHPLVELMYFVGYWLGDALRDIETNYLGKRQVQQVEQQHFHSLDVSRLADSPVTRKSSLATMNFAVFEPGVSYILKTDFKKPCRLRGVLFNGSRVGNKLSISTSRWRVVKNLRFHDNNINNPVDKLRIICRPIFNSECIVNPGDELLLQISSDYQESEHTSHCFDPVVNDECLELHSFVFESLDEPILIGGLQLQVDLLPDLQKPFAAIGPLLRNFLKYRDVADKSQLVVEAENPWF